VLIYASALPELDTTAIPRGPIAGLPLYLYILCSAVPELYRFPLDSHHGDLEYFEQWAEYYSKLPEHRQRPAAIRTAGELSHLWPMGRFYRGCPAGERISARRREGERVEGPEHRRYVLILGECAADWG
jgi:hypothetical protein